MPNATTVANTESVKLDDLLQQPEIQQALATVVRDLPRLAMLMHWFGKAWDIGADALSDAEMWGALEDMIQEKVGTRVKDVRAAFAEAKERAEKDCSTIGIFGVLRLLKDPNVQKSLRYVQAFLRVMSERQAARGEKPCP